MSEHAANIRLREKWRPSVGAIVALVLATALALPLAGLFFFRIYENQLIHQTESELIGQSAVLAAIMRRDIESLPASAPLGAEAQNTDDPNEPYRPIMPTLDLASDDILAARPEAQPAPSPADPAFVASGERLALDLVETRRITLAGFRLLDPFGVVIAGREEVGQSLAHIEEVAEALRGRFRSVLRSRISKHEPPPLYSWSRGTGVRVFVAMPVIARGHVAGVVYASRTPSNIFKSLYEERGKVVAAGLIIFALALLIGLIFQRAITRPMRDLMVRTAAIARGERTALTPLTHHGTREFAQLSSSFLDMAKALQTRSEFVTTFAAHVSHELKSPLTAIQGAAELLRDDSGSMKDDERRRFLDNIIADAKRLAALVQRLRELARAENAPIAGDTSLETAILGLRSRFEKLRISASGDLDCAIAVAPDNLRIILSHLADNAVQHGASALTISGQRQGEEIRILVCDDGAGVSDTNRDRIFDSFFTTRRETGGTGMGLAIVRAMLETHGGKIELLDKEAEGPAGAAFALVLPSASRNKERR